MQFPLVYLMAVAHDFPSCIELQVKTIHYSFNFKSDILRLLADIVMLYAYLLEAIIN